MTKDYSNSRFFAISGIGYGKGDSAEEARENYVASQLRNIPASRTVYKTRAKWEKALRTGDAQPQIWEAPEGAVGFTLGYGGLQWEMKSGSYTPAEADQRREEVPVRYGVCSSCGSSEEHHVAYVRQFGLCVL